MKGKKQNEGTNNMTRNDYFDLCPLLMTFRDQMPRKL